jgi:hypothetical protein
MRWAAAMLPVHFAGFATDGDCEVGLFRTSFAKRSHTPEPIALERALGAAWRVIGCFIRK